MNDQDLSLTHKAIMDVGSALGEPKVFTPMSGGARQFLVIPEGYESKEIDLESYAQTPYRSSGTTTLATVESFLDFTSRENIPDTTVCFADLNRSNFKAVFNHAGPAGSPGWGDRVAVLDLKTTTSWDRWMGANGKKFNQLSLCDFLEANVDDIRSPEMIKIVEMLQHLKIHKKIEITNIVDPQTGFSTASYTETISGESIKGDIDLCSKIVVGLLPFRGTVEGAKPYPLNVSLRHSADDNGRLITTVAVINHEIVEELAFAEEKARVVAGMKALNIPIYDI